jgi:pimeloyl-ACP methyl ester carboxylesterase
MDGVTIAADGVEIHYETHGEGSPALVFVHGWCCDRHYWQKQIDAFASRYTVVAIDLAGHGDSGENRINWSIHAFAQDVIAVVEALGLTQVVLIGHSMGGPVIVEAARYLPTRVIGLVGADTLLNPERKRTKEENARRIARLQADFRREASEFIRAGMFVPTSDAAWAQSIVEDMIAAPPHIGVGAMEGLLSNDDELRAGLRAIQAPVVLINSNNLPTNLEATQRYGLTVEIMSGVGHFVMIEDAERFNGLLEKAVRGMVAQKTES